MSMSLEQHPRVTRSGPRHMEVLHLIVVILLIMRQMAALLLRVGPVLSGLEMMTSM